VHMTEGKKHKPHQEPEQKAQKLELTFYIPEAISQEHSSKKHQSRKGRGTDRLTPCHALRAYIAGGHTATSNDGGRPCEASLEKWLRRGIDRGGRREVDWIEEQIDRGRKLLRVERRGLMIGDARCCAWRGAVAACCCCPWRGGSVADAGRCCNTSGCSITPNTTQNRA
jgi:hypothetical protein